MRPLEAASTTLRKKRLRSCAYWARAAHAGLDGHAWPAPITDARELVALRLFLVVQYCVGITSAVFQQPNVEVAVLHKFTAAPVPATAVKNDDAAGRRFDSAASL